ADGEASELVIGTWNRLQRVAVRIGREPPLEVGHGVQPGVVLMFVDAAVPAVGSGFGDDVHHRTGVASVFRPKLAADQNVLLDKLRTGAKQTGTADAVVIVVLSVNLLVIVTSAKTVNREPGAAVGVGEPVVARRGDARDKQRQVVKPLVFSNAGEGCE